jgi:hypothetical protein
MLHFYLLRSTTLISGPTHHSFLAMIGHSMAPEDLFFSFRFLFGHFGQDTRSMMGEWRFDPDCVYDSFS